MGRGLLNAFLQASDQKVSVLEDMGLQCRGRESGNTDKTFAVAADARRA